MPSNNKKILLENLKPYAMALDIQVKDACFGKDVSPDYLQTIKVFKQAYLALGVSVTPKVHCVVEHVAKFCALGWDIHIIY
jgi:hypothetical protein